MILKIRLYFLSPEITGLVVTIISIALKEVFGTGTAVTVAPINSITVGDKKIEIESQINSYASKLKKTLQGIQNGSIKDVYGWTSKVNSVVSGH